MRVLLAGATGAIGRPLLEELRAAGHEVLALTRKPAAQVPGARLVVADVLDRDALLRAVEGISADVVIHQLTALSKPPARYADMDMTNTLRTVGTAHLLEAARTVGARRFLTQSMVPGYGYADHGTRLLTESDPFGRRREGKVGPIVAALHSTEQQVLTADGIEGIALRYGAFYGLTGSDGVIAALRAGKLPVPRDGGGTMSWIHLADAAAATVAAMDKGRAGQAYNIVDDEPVTWGQMIAEHAGAAGTRPPRRLPGWAIRLAAPYFATLMVDTSMRVSNLKARAELGWTPALPTYREGVHAPRA
ncbi:NAD-dependent epimerase/dehydratase family protein [Actinomadura kijaniata]|uniref:NAD-dependent epimerase/dehydratase family protein n=1 Tax=Actinomadura kijaniata TaxID=46161 RepID=UPI00082AA5B9|nr:NAD(P)-dependent oxidoreductase [Actinomadura kijaniata]